MCEIPLLGPRPQYHQQGLLVIKLFCPNLYERYPEFFIFSNFLQANRSINDGRYFSFLWVFPLRAVNMLVNTVVNHCVGLAAYFLYT